jgi:hypothetical protein
MIGIDIALKYYTKIYLNKSEAGCYGEHNNN